LQDPVVGAFTNYGRVDAWRALNLLPQLEPWYPTTPRIHWVSPHRLPATGGVVTIFGRGFGWDARAGRVLLQGRQLVALGKPAPRGKGVETYPPIPLPYEGRGSLERSAPLLVGEGMGVRFTSSPRPVPRPQPVLQVLEWGDSRIVVRVPPGATSGWLQVQVRGRGSNRHSLTVESSSTLFAAAPSDVGIVGRYGRGAQMSGGYAELLEADGQTLVARPRTDNRVIDLKLLVRGLDKSTVSTIVGEYVRRYEGVAGDLVESILL
ncbi:MAG: hypothetical protein NZ741_12645, partial [Armatimonadetes bacterium]|nr:hypothetical protein [Armatimonadota bacterium]